MDPWKQALDELNGVIDSGWSSDYTKHQIGRIMQTLESEVKELTPPAPLCRVCGNSTKG
jgi:hypothetical protein